MLSTKIIDTQKDLHFQFWSTWCCLSVGHQFPTQKWPHNTHNRSKWNSQLLAPCYIEQLFTIVLYTTQTVGTLTKTNLPIRVWIVFFQILVECSLVKCSPSPTPFLLLDVGNCVGVEHHLNHPNLVSSWETSIWNHAVSIHKQQSIQRVMIVAQPYT